MVVFSKLNDSAASGAYSFVFAYCVSEVSGAMLALAAVLLRGSGFVSSFVISAVEPLELLNLALSTHLLALVLLAFPFCRALQETRHENSSGLSVIDQAVQATATKETGMRHALEYNCTMLCCCAHLWIQNLLCHSLSLSLLPHSHHTRPHGTVSFAKFRRAHERLHVRGDILCQCSKLGWYTAL